MTPYLLLLLITGVSGFAMCEYRPSNKKNLIFLLLITTILITLAGIRASSVGVDTEPYCNFFNFVSGKGSDFALSNDFQMEYGYYFLNYLISLLTKDALLGISIISVLIIVLRLICIWKYSSSIWISIFIYISFGFFGYSMCTLRQELGISIAFFALPFLKGRKFIPYLIIILLASSFHVSMLILIPVYFIAYFPINWKYIIAYLSVTILIMLFSEPIVSIFIKIYPKFESYEPGTYFMLGRNFNTLFIPLLLFIVAFLMRKTILGREDSNIVHLNFILFSTLLFVLTLKHFIFQRVALIFFPISIFLIPELLNSLKPQGENDYLIKEHPKRNSKKYVQYKWQLKEKKQLYNTALALTLICSSIYYLFLLYANRLLLVPYLSRLI
ncbi:MAG: EpsG family protein [Ruminococcaceae bacterium]|nr:EpsG family protein [Oscillospiraceae bacterium]